MQREEILEYILLAADATVQNSVTLKGLLNFQAVQISVSPTISVFMTGMAANMKFTCRGGEFFTHWLITRGGGTGVLVATGKNPKYVKTPSSLDEIFQQKVNPWPEKLVQVFSDGTGIEVMEKNPVQSNIGEILDSMRGNFFKASQESFSGKALITDGRLSMWVKVKDPNVMQRLEMNSEKGFFIKCGFNIRTASNEAYGVDLTPVAADITSDYITDFVRTSLTDIVKNKEYYTTKGIGKPPIWFVDVKIENTERYDLKPDVRD